MAHVDEVVNDDALAVIVDFHFLIGDDGTEIVKELAIMDVTRFAGRHWIFEPPANAIVSNPKHVKTNQWLTDNFHGIAWTDGETSYAKLQSILDKNTFPFNYVFVKGLQKKRFLDARIVHFNIINLEDFGCPKLEHLRVMDGTACHAHRFLPEICTYHRVHALREWFLEDFRLVSRFLVN